MQYIYYIKTEASHDVCGLQRLGDTLSQGLPISKPIGDILSAGENVSQRLSP